MSNRTWIGQAQAVAQVSSVTVTAYDATTTYTLAVGAKSVSTLGTGGTAATTAAALQALAAASAQPEFTDAVWTVNSATITATSATAGTPFTFTASVSGGAGTVGSVSTGTASAGPADWSTAADWSGGAAPVNSDVVYLDATSPAQPVQFGLSQSGVTLASLNIAAAFTADVGLPKLNPEGYGEYRADYLAVGATAINVGYGEGQGSQRVKIDTGSVQTAVVVQQTGSPAEQNVPAMLWRGTNASNTVEVARGSFGAAVYGGESATISALNVGFIGSQDSDASFLGGSGLTLTTLNQLGGSVTLNAGLTTVNKRGGSLAINAGSVTTLTCDAGSVAYNGTGTIGTLNLSGPIDFSGDMRGCTVTNCNLYPGAVINDPYGRVTWTNPIQLVRCGLPDVTINTGKNRTVQFT